ncbi:MAG: YbjN domain-containing protein [Myxococcota bacterium]|jgi:hypothetical protein|nr:YbjN domain-containing protein [Myxococcota bacterium]
MITIDRLERFFSSRDIPLDPDGFEDRIWRHRCAGDRGEWDYTIIWEEKPPYVRVTSSFPERVPAARREEAATFVAQTNAGLRVGGLSFNPQSGELSFITGLLLEGIDADFEKLMEQIFFINMASMEELLAEVDAFLSAPKEGSDPLEVAKRFLDHLDGNGWPVELLDVDDIAQHSPEDHVRIKTGCRASNGQWYCLADIQPSSDIVAFYSYFPVEIPEDRYAAIVSFITQANYGMFVGNFAIDLDDGELRFKTSIDVEGVEPKQASKLFERLVAANIATMDRYFPGITAVLQGTSPEEAIALVED